jgi:hypothetical protein
MTPARRPAVLGRDEFMFYTKPKDPTRAARRCRGTARAVPLHRSRSPGRIHRTSAVDRRRSPSGRALRRPAYSARGRSRASVHADWRLWHEHRRRRAESARRIDLSLSVRGRLTVRKRRTLQLTFCADARQSQGQRSRAASSPRWQA